MEGEVRVYMAPYEYETYLDHCDRRERLASRIIGECSPRIGKTANLIRDDFFVPDDPRVELAFVRLRETKDSTEGENALGGKTRVSWVPWDLYEEVQQYCDDEGIEDDDEIFGITADWLGDQIGEAAESTAVATGDSDYKHITSHDLRAYYATNMVRRLGVDIEVVMEMGSWGSRKAIEPYLASPLPRDLQDELARAGVTQKDIPAPPRQDDFGKILNRLEQIERALDLRNVVDVSSLTKSDVQALKDQIDAEEQESEKAEFESKTSLNDFMNAATLSTAVALGMMVTAKESLARLRHEQAAMRATTTEPTPKAGAAAYTLGMLVVLLPIMVSTGALFSPDLATAAVGGVVGATRFNFDSSK
jgi:hypothetical protein